MKTYVYLVRCTVTNRIKIGKASNVRLRMDHLQIGSPTKLELVGTIEGSAELERVLHAIFGHKRLHGEWFDVTADEVLKAAESLTMAVCSDATELFKKKLKPPKPSEDFPMYAHANGQWAKKIKGKTLFFGRWEEPQSALARFREMAI